MDMESNGKNLKSKILIIAALCALIPAAAHGAVVADNIEELTQPTLTEMNEFDDVDPFFSVNHDSAYILTLSDTETENTVKKYLETDSGYQVLLYSMDNARKEYGDRENYSEARYYKWAPYHFVSGSVDVTVDNALTTEGAGAGDFDYAYYVSNSVPKASARLTTAFSGTKNSNFIDLEMKDRYNVMAYGGAIANIGLTMGDIEGDFISNFVNNGSFKFDGRGGAIYNENGAIGNITGNFIKNYIKSNFTAHGGAIYNLAGTIKDINGDFIGNYATDMNAMASGEGGAIYNGVDAHIQNINGNFTGNFVISKAGSIGGAIRNNQGTIDSITGDFIKNFAYSNTSAQPSNGGAIANTGGVISSIIGDFLGNYAFSEKRDGFGGAIYNAGTNAEIGYISGDFISNKINALAYVQGGAIYNKDSKIGNIDGNFAQNSTTSTPLSYGDAEGGAIYNGNGSIGIINGDFTDNNMYLTTNGVTIVGIRGGALYNSGTIEEINGDFLNNRLNVEIRDNALVAGGAVYNSGTIGAINGNFTGNNWKLTTKNPTGVDITVGGGAIYNDNGIIGSIQGDFENNYVIMEKLGKNIRNQKVVGGAIANDGGKIGNITGNFTGNSAKLNLPEEINNTNLNVMGGAVYNTGTIGDDNSSIKGFINASFKDNYVSSNIATALGGAVYTSTDLTFNASNGLSEFTGNYTENAGVRDDNAIYVASDTASLNFNAINNGVFIINDNINGLGGYKINFTGDGTGTVNLNNSLKNADVSVSDITMNFANNIIENHDFTKLTSDASAKYGIDVDYASGTSDTLTVGAGSSGVVKLSILNLMGDYDSPVTYQILHAENDDIQLDVLDNIIAPPDIENTVYNDNIIANGGAVEITTTNTTNDSITIKDKIYDGLVLINQKTSDEDRNFIFRTADKYIVSENLGETGKGVLNIKGISGTQNIIDGNQHSLFELKEDTTLNVSNIAILNAKSSGNGAAINAQTDTSSVNLLNSSFKDNVSDGNGGAIYSKSDINIKADAGNSVFSGNKSNTNIPNAIYLDNASKTLTLKALNEGLIRFDDTIDGQKGYNVNISGDSKSKVVFNNKVNNAVVKSEDVTLTLGKKDVFEKSDFTINSGTLSLLNNSAETQLAQSFHIGGDINLAADVNLAEQTMDRLPENTTLGRDVKIHVSHLNLLNDAYANATYINFAQGDMMSAVDYTGANSVAYSPIYKYNVSYDQMTGMFGFMRSSTQNPSDNYNPSVLTSPVSAQAAGYTTQLQTFNYAFQHADSFMQNPMAVRTAIRNQNRYAMSPTSDTADVGVFSPLFTEPKGRGIWVKPYSSFENVPLKNGPNVQSISYGTLIGYDTNLIPLKHGFDAVLTGYIGYNGTTQHYNGVSADQNGGVLGGTATFYKNNFFSALTLSAGGSAGAATSMFGRDEYAMVMAGIANKTGYNFEFKEGRFILQPSIQLSYTFVNTFDYTNAQGVRINSDPLNALQIAPGVKFIGNTKSGWQPYLAATMVWNVMDETKVRANDVKLPEMSIRPYIEYGLGVQKKWNDNFTAYLQAMIRNGGRNGVALSAGFRWALGKKGT